MAYLETHVLEVAGETWRYWEIRDKDMNLLYGHMDVHQGELDALVALAGPMVLQETSIMVDISSRSVKCTFTRYRKA